MYVAAMESVQGLDSRASAEELSSSSDSLSKEEKLGYTQLAEEKLLRMLFVQEEIENTLRRCNSGVTWEELASQVLDVSAKKQRI